MTPVRSSKKWLVVMVAVVCGMSSSGIAAGQCPPIIAGCGSGCCDVGETPLTLTCNSLDSGIFTISVSGDPSTWFWIHARAFLEQPQPGAETEAAWQELVGTFPWLRKDCWTIDPVASPTFVDFVTVHPDLTVDKGGQHLLQAPLAQSHPIAAAWWERAAQWGQPNLVRSYYQPIPIGGTRMWVVNCQTWVENVASGPISPITVWRPRLATNADDQAYSTNFEKYSAERIAQSAILEQAPCPHQAKLFLNQGMGLAVEKGMLSFTLSAVGAINPLDLGPTGPNDSQVPSIFAPVPNDNLPPRLRVSPGSPMTVPLRSAAASWGPWNGAFLGATASASYGYVVVPMRGMLPPVTMLVSVNGQTSLLSGEFDSVGKMKFPLDPSWVFGTQIQILLLTNRIGSVPYPWPPITVRQ